MPRPRCEEIDAFIADGAHLPESCSASDTTPEEPTD